MKKINIKSNTHIQFIEVLRPSFLEGHMKIWAINLQTKQEREKAIRLGKRVPMVGKDDIKPFVRQIIWRA